MSSPLAAALPSFLEPLDAADYTASHISAIHRTRLGAAHAIWFPSKQPQSPPGSVLLFIPGNPGLNDLYTLFLSTIRDKDSSGKLAILAHSHIGHTPSVGIDDPKSEKAYGLAAQVQNALYAFDALRSTFGSNIKIIVVGHSVGSWVSLQVLKARIDASTNAFLLFPTLSSIASTPNGQRLSWLFRSPVPRIVSSLCHVAALLPSSLFPWIFPTYPASQAHVIRRYVQSSTAVYASLLMAQDEMRTIRDLDTHSLDIHKHHLWLYFAERDDWVGAQREVVLRALRTEPDSVRIVRGHGDIPHAFCINHGEELASQCLQWLASIPDSA
ncbi:hypothetical protein PLICRDRAFT_50181 [Plicaturopsis crispa FD-325 SS-3]|nr:hypothetical protein PLICRDRAFT_50181 [Plicaturopsis crispa FD-325 SS-3]